MADPVEAAGAPQHAPHPHHPPQGGVAALERRLSSVRSRARWMLVGGALAVLIAGLIAVALSVGLLDYLVRLPAGIRGVILLAGLGVLVVEAWRRVAPALSFRPALTDVALRLERSEEGRRAGLGGVLASGLELSRDSGPGSSRSMASRVVTDAERRFAGARAGSLIRPGPTLQSALVMAVCLLGLAGVVLVAGAPLASIGATRVLAPWAGAEWPKRTQLADATGLSVHPVNTALPLRAALRRTDRAMGETRIFAAYRLAGDSASPRRVQLTGQGKRSTVEVSGERLSGELYERLIEPASLGLSAARGTPELEYWFESADDRTEPRTVKLVQPPAIVQASAVITPPPYAQVGGGAFLAGRHDLGPGNDQRAVVGPVLGGSHIQLMIRLNKPVPTPSALADEESRADRARWLAAAFPRAELGEDLSVSFNGVEWTLGWRADQSVRLPVIATDEYGLRSAEEATFAIDVSPDRAPTASVLEPREDESVLATAVVPATGEGRDDVGLAAVSLSRQIARPPKGSMGAAAEAAGPSVTVASRDLVAEPQGPGPALQAGVTLRLDLATLDLNPGDEVWLTAVAVDAYELRGARHEPVRSSVRRLRIIKDEELVDQIRAELGAMRKVAMRLDEDQGELRKPIERGSVSSEERRRQGGLTGRITQQNESLQRLSERVERNRLQDEALKDVLAEVDSLLKEAAAASERASSEMEAAARQSPDPDRAELGREEQERIAREQEAVRESLSKLAEMLDKGEDTWALSRTLQRLAQQQRDLKARTERAGESTMGKKAGDLTPQERAELAEIAERQERLAEQTRQAIDQLEQRAEQLKGADPAQAEAMKQAAEQGRQQQVPQKMEDAAEQVQQNQTSQATEQQQEAADALDQMLEQMQQAQRNRDANLRRVLADVVKLLDGLIVDQQGQIEALAGAAPTAAYAGLDAPMMTLNRNTLDVAGTARAERAMARVATLVDRAAKAQDGAITALRASPVAVEDAEQGEKESLRLLTLARAEAEKLRDDAANRDAQRKRQELRQLYRQALEEQAAIKGETDPFIGRQIERRDRIKVRGIGERQDTLRQTLADVKAKTEELAEAGVFEYAHERLETSTAIAGKKLRAGQADAAVERNQASAMRVLASLIKALDEQLQRDDEFRDDAGGGGGGGGGGEGERPPMLPPLAELRLLREMQAEAATVTRSIDEAKEPAPEEMGSLGELQRNLATRGDELVKKMQEAPPGLRPGPRKDEPAPGGEGGGDGGNGG
ncbi:MAG: hypothetical protein WD749_15245 [Phycisphaerales bacterium]